MTSKSTPGPWEITSQNGDPEEGFRGITGPERTNSLGKNYRLYVAQYCLPHDAELIAAAPDLLDALKGSLASFKCTQKPEHYPADHWCNKAIDAIAKATGESK